MPSGKLVVRMPPHLHQDLQVIAAAQGVSLNTLIVTLLASGAERYATTRA